MASYTVYRVEYLGLPRNHHAIFVETNEQGNYTGHLFQVTGDIQQGMSFEDKPAKQPENSGSYQEKLQIGTVTHMNYPQIKTICESIPPPRKQFAGPKRIYPNEPLRRCQEWTAEATQALVDAHVLQQEG